MENQKTNVKVVAAAFIGIFFFGVAFLVLGAVLPSLKGALALTDAQASTLASTLPLGTLLGSLVFGPVIDRRGYKILLAIATALGIVGMELLAFTGSFNVAVCAVALIGVCGGMLNGSTNALVSDSSSDRTRTSNIFILGLVYCLGAYAITAIISAATKASLPYAEILKWTGVIMAVSLVYYLVIRFPEAKCKQGVPVKDMLKMAAEPTLLIFGFTLFFQSGLEGMANNWTSTFLGTPEKGFSIEAAGKALTFIPIGLAISRALLSVISRFASNKAIVLVSMCFAAAGEVLIWTASSEPVVMAGAIVLGMGLAATFPVCFSILGEKYKQMSGTAFSVALVIALIGNTILNKIVGALGASSLPVVILVAIVCLVGFFLTGCKVSKKA